MAKSNRPELLKLRSQYNNDGRKNGMAMGEVYSFPSKPMPHGLLLIFKDYNYQTYVSSVAAVYSKENPGEVTGVGANSNLGLLQTLSAQAAGDVGLPAVTSSTAIELPFPRTLNDTQNIRVQQFERDFLYERLASGLAQFDTGGGIDGMISNISTTAESMLDNINNYGRMMGQKANVEGYGATILQTLKDSAAALGNFDSSKAAAMAGYLARNFISGEIAKSIAVVGERTVNPQETLSFSGVDLRNFTFTWDLFPSNRTDSQMIKEIVNLVKQKSLPTTEDAGAGGITAKAFLNYPSIVELYLLGVDEEHFMRFKRCMVSNITVDYGGGGMPEILKGGRPAVVSLSISFSELAIHTSEDYGGQSKTGGKDITISKDLPLGMTDFDPGIVGPGERVV